LHSQRELKVILRLIALCSLLFVNSPKVLAQDSAAETRALRLSAFGGGGGTWTGLRGGQNLQVTAGADVGLEFLTFKGFLPSLEIRGSYPIYAGTYDAQSNLLGGIKFERQFHKFHLYGDVLAGRGHLNYSRPRMKLHYPTSDSAVLGGGGGFDYDLSRRFQFKGDVQYQRYGDVAPSPTNSVRAVASMIGLVYVF